LIHFVIVQKKNYGSSSYSIGTPLSRSGGGLQDPEGICDKMGLAQIFRENPHPTLPRSTGGGNKRGVFPREGWLIQNG
jgi:hypothetical protein